MGHLSCEGCPFSLFNLSLIYSILGIYLYF